ncbi:uncharacterized protein BDV17DRAFT_278085 [Aspergillus undulatus]|uniref:uncharacterized protein n=1 Tax=Aspergillus undulatus TaxID=1810928 RepID=UPI003CCCF300
MAHDVLHETSLNCALLNFRAHQGQVHSFLDQALGPRRARSGHVLFSVSISLCSRGHEAGHHCP